MNWLTDIFYSIKWKIEDAVWAIQDKITLAKELKNIEKEWDDVEELEVKPKKKIKKKNVKKTKKSV